MLIVYVALHFSCNAADFFGPQVAVQCRKLYGDKTNIQRNEHIFKIVAALVIISGQTGEVFDNYTVDFLCVNISQKPLKVLTVAVSTSPSIVLIVVYHLNFRVVCQIIVEDSVLVLDTVTYIVSVLFGKSFIFSALPNFLAVLCKGVIRRFSASFQDTSNPL